MALSHVVMECLQFLWKPPGLGPGQPPFSGQGRTGCVRGGEPGQKRVGSVETGWGRERGERRILLPLNALSPSSPRAAGKSTSDFSPSARVAVATWDHCRHGVLSNCRLTKSWVSTPRSASRRSISGDQAVSPTESLTEEAQSDWELVFSRTANVFNLRNLTFLKSRQASTLLRHAPCQDRRQTGPDLETADETGVCGVF